MSTKTTFKRVALVAVAALGLGVLTTVPSQATINADTLTLSSATSAQTTAETSTATSAVATVSFLGSALDSLSVTSSLVSGPAGNTALPRLQLVETSSATVEPTNIADLLADFGPNSPVVVQAQAGTAVTTAKFKVYLGKDNLNAPTVAGTYVVKLTPATVNISGALNATAVTLTITVTTSALLDTVGATATVLLNKGETNSATSDATVTHPKTVSTTVAAATITVAQKNAAGVALTAANGESFTAVLTGAGTLGSGTWSNAAIDNTGVTATGRAISVQAGDVVNVFPDGSSGVGTVTISSKAGVVFATKSITFYGDATAISAKATGAATGSIGAVSSAKNLITFTVKDAAGTDVTTGTYYVVTDNTAIANATAYTACNAWNSTDGFTCPVTGVAKGTANLYVTNRASATATTPTTEVKSDKVAVRIGSATVASIKVTMDKTTYAPGEKATLTVQVLDADGNAVPSGRYNNIFADGGIASSYALAAGTDTTTALDAIGTVDGAKTYTLYMPQVVTGDIKLSWTTGTNFATSAAQGVAGSTTVSVVNTVADAATDAANEATDAANAATDAALAAADAADAATAAAEDASAAVAKLAKSVNTALNNLKKQITALTALVNKLLK
ncbi:hypothetical protein MCEMRE185_00065 [Candidatus Nanopelagicaceae bacterium]